MNSHVPPLLIDCARVLYFASMDSSVRYMDRRSMFVYGGDLGPVPKLAICRNLADAEVLLLYCNENWKSLAASRNGTVEEVMASAERDYEGVSALWKPSPYSDLEFAKHVADEFDELRCSFCGAFIFESADVEFVRGRLASICSICIERLHSAMSERAVEGAVTDPLEDEH